MRAVVLVGGEGTRLRPLTSTVPKPVVTLVDRPFLAFMLEWLARHGVDEVVLACGFLPTKLRDALGDGSRYGLHLTGGSDWHGHHDGQPGLFSVDREQILPFLTTLAQA